MQIEGFPSTVKLPEIQHGSENRKWPEGRLIVQEKIDGSNFTVYRPDEHSPLLFFNKGKPVKADQSVWERTCRALSTRAYLFRPGYVYHGEAMRATRSCHIMYKQVPRFYWMCYEIIAPGTSVCMTPEEMDEILKDTGIQQARIYYDSKYADETSPERLDNLFKSINMLPSCLGNYAEGFVVKVLQYEKKGKLVTYRCKYVSDHMRERKPIEGVMAPDCTVESIGDLFNVPARFRKAVQHLQERGEEVTPSAVAAECDADLLKEYEQEIREMLWNRYWNTIKRTSRADLYKFMNQ